MGTWDVGSLDNDNSRDIYDAYLSLFDVGKSASAILKRLKSEHLDARDAQDRAEFWPAVAQAQWECGQVSEDVIKSLKKVIERRDGMDAWRAEGAKRAARREHALAELLARIQLPNPQPRPRKAAEREQAAFRPGDCVAFAFPDGRWGAAVAFKGRAGMPGSNLIKVLNYRDSNLPTMAVFEKRQWHHAMLPNGQRAEDPFAMPLPGNVVRASPEKYKLIGRLKLDDADHPEWWTLPFGDVGKIVAAKF